MFHLPLYSRSKLILAFEYAMTIFNVAKEQNVEVTAELTKRAEEMILNEFHKSPERIAIEMLPNVLSIFETK
jgi:hypothetical protein